MFEIIPGILEKEWEKIEAKLELVKPFAKTVHIDLLDGKFADNATFLDPEPFKKYSDYFFFELHMMVDNPIQYLKPFADAGFKRFLGHIEKMPDQVAFVADGQLLGEVGLAIDGSTSLEKMSVSYEDLDCLLIMTIKAGISGQSFISSHLEKVKQVRAKHEFLTIEVDGGINDKTILLAKDAGVTRFVTTSFLYGDGNPQKQYKKLLDLLHSHELSADQ